MSRGYHSLSQSLSPENVLMELEELRCVEKLVDKLWQREVSIYEFDESIKDFKKGPDTLVNLSIFPYHKALFPLLDIYHLISREAVNDYTINSPTNVFDKKRRLPEGEVRVAGYLPCSALAVWKSLVPPYRAQNSRERFVEALGDPRIKLPSPVLEWGSIESTDFSFLEEWNYDIVTEKLAWAGVTYTPDSVHNLGVLGDIEQSETNTNLDDGILTFDERNDGHVKSDSNPFGILNLPTDLGLRTKIMLKLLKHSLSNLQRDHRLARAVLYAMIEFRCFDFGENSKSGVDALRYLLAVIHSESVRTCMGECHEPFVDDDATVLSEQTDVDDSFSESKGLAPRPDHYCQDWQEFESSIMTIFGFGIDCITNEHANVICAFTTQQFEMIGFIELDGGDDLLGCWHDDFEVEYLNLVTHIVIGVGVHAKIMRHRIKKVIQKMYSKSGGENTPEVRADLKKLSLSYRNCIRVLVDIGEQSLRRLPANDQTANLGGYIVGALMTLLNDEIPLSLNKLAPVAEYIGNQCKTKPLLINPMRYSELITNASNQQSLRVEDIKKSVLVDCVSESENDEFVREIFLSPPSKDVQDVVRCLFLRQLVDTGISGCGYGDFLTWHRLPVSPLESMLFEHAVQYPEDEENQREGGWGLDEEETENHSGKKLAARYDFSLLMLNRAWSLPWSPKSHPTFQLPFRHAIKTLALCTQRHGIPSAILVGLFEYLPRHWWPDERAECWRYECQLTEVGKLLNRKRSARTSKTCKHYTSRGEDRRKTETKSYRFFTCTGCEIAKACSPKHLKRVEGHTTCCQKPPFRPFRPEDEEFCRKVMGNVIAPVEILPMKRSADGFGIDRIESEEDLDSDDDSGSWESIASDEDSKLLGDNTVSKTDLIFRYFDTNTYKLQQFEEPGFANVIDGGYY